MATTSEYTPTTDDVRERYAEDYEPNNGFVLRGDRDYAEFDRWLRTVKAEAWEEGRRSSAIYYPDEKRTEWPTNPYREDS